MSEEQVFGFERRILDSLGSFQGFSEDISRYLPSILDPKNTSFRPRSIVETDPSFKQVIPYVVITDGDRILHYVRGKKSGEQRLIAKGSIGIGGHINSTDDGLFTYEMAVEREVTEEIKIDGKFSAPVIGLINDDSTEVGAVHFGVVHLLRRKPSEIKKKEQIITQMDFLTIAELLQRKETLETWSQLCVEPLKKLLSAPASALAQHA